MLAPALFAIALAQTGQMPFTSQMSVDQPARLAITPKIDGELAIEEWDPLANDGNVESFFQWQPNKLHIAARVPVGQDLILSLDTQGNGWLQGKDNLEIRVKLTDGGRQVSQRLLDSTQPAGPVWTDASNYQAATQVAVKSDGSHWVAEISIQDPGTFSFPQKPGSKIGMRVDGVAHETTDPEPFYPRAMTMLTLGMERGKDLPTGLVWKPEFQGRSVVPGEANKIRLTFNGTDDLGLGRIEMRTEGFGRNDTASQGVPFPKFDNKGRAFVDYETKVAPDAAVGYRVMRGTVYDAQDRPSVLQVSYELAPVITFDFNDPKDLKSSAEPQKATLATYIRSNTRRRVDGIFSVKLPEGWELESGDGKNFIIYNSRGSKRQVFGVMIPGGFTGIAPITLRADVGGQITEQTVWIQIP